MDRSLEQLQGTAVTAEDWIPAGQRFRLVPVLAHGGKSLRAAERKMLGRRKVMLHGQKAQAVLRRCGAAIADVLT